MKTVPSIVLRLARDGNVLEKEGKMKFASQSQLLYRFDTIYINSVLGTPEHNNTT